MNPSDTISIIVPLFNEADSLRTLYDEVVSMSINHSIDFDLVLVDDGSTDNSWDVIESICASDSRVKGIRFRRNFGKAAAMAAGIEHSRSPIVVTMDADLQDDPNEIPRLLKKLNEGHDCVSGWKQVRHDPWHKTYPSKFFNSMLNRFTGMSLHDHNCGLKIYRREIFDEVQLYGDMHRFIPALANARGFRVDEISVEHRARQFGESKYGLSRLPKGFLDLITVYLLTNFRQRPIHAIGTAGLAIFAAGIVAMTWLTLIWCVSRMSSQIADVHLHERALFYYGMVAVVIGVQLVSMGILAELVIAAHRPHTTPYSIRKIAKSEVE